MTPTQNLMIYAVKTIINNFSTYSSDNHIDMIKELRVQSGMGLKQCKNIVDAFFGNTTYGSYDEAILIGVTDLEKAESVFPERSAKVLMVMKSDCRADVTYETTEDKVIAIRDFTMEALSDYYYNVKVYKEVSAT